MRQFTSLVLFTFLFICSVTAQFSISVSSGSNLSSASFSNIDQVDPEILPGLFIGITPAYDLNDKIAISVGVQYSQKGMKLSNSGVEVGSEFRYSYIDFLPEINYWIHQNITFGLGFNYGVNTEEKQKLGSEDWFSTEEFDAIKGTDFGLTAKLAGYYHNFFAFMRYNLGLTNISNVNFTDMDGMVIDDAKQFNRNIQMGLGYRIQL